MLYAGILEIRMDDKITYLENIGEYVSDEGKLVTYKWLSRMLSVHVNVAKQLLYAYLIKERNEKDNDVLSVVYLLSGLKCNNDNKTNTVLVVSEEKLEAAKKTLSSVSSCHVYSVQKVKPKDSNLLYIADYDLLKEQLLHSNEYSAIKNKEAVIRSDTEVEKLKEIAQPTSVTASFTKKSDVSVKSSSTAKKAGIADMFSASSKKKDNTDTKKTESNAEPTKSDSSVNNSKKESNQKNKGGLQSFFSKASKPKQEPSPKVDDDSKSDKEETKGQNDKEDTNVKSPVKSIQKKQESKPAVSKKKKKGSDEEEPLPQQKRRRIQTKVWSDDSSSESEMETEEPIPSPPPPEPTPPPSPKHSSPPPSEKPQKDTPEKENKLSNANKQKRRKRVKKLVSKTTVDENGFMVTEKVYESESATDASETEETKPTETVPTKNTTKPLPSKTTKQKTSPNKASKQTNLMSFFKKK